MQVVAEQVRGAHHPCQVPHHLVAPVQQHPATERSCCGNPSTQTMHHVRAACALSVVTRPPCASHTSDARVVHRAARAHVRSWGSFLRADARGT